MTDFYPYGTQYYRFPTPLPDEWEADMANIAAAGYTHVQFHPQWRAHERIQGEWVWDDIDRLFEIAHRNGLRVGLQPMLETAPDWVFSELQGTRVGFQGVPLQPIALGAFYVGGWLPCFDNPQVISAALEFIRHLAERYGDHPAMWFFSAWNEPRSRPLGQCQCPHSVASYREWLENRFGTIEDLNASLGKAWTSYDTVIPPTSAWDYADMYLWRQWAAYAVSEHVQQVCETIREVRPDALVVAHSGGCSVLQDVACDACDDLLNAEASDSYGTSFPIPLSPKTPMEHAAPDFISDWLRRVDPSYWLHEFYANHGSWCCPPDPNTLRRLIWMGIAGGASAFTYWQYRSERYGNETNGYGLREIDGSPTTRSEVADRVARILRHDGTKLAASRRSRSRIAMLYSRESDIISRVMAMETMFADQEQERYDYPYKRAIKAAHAMYLQRGETVDWVVPGDDLSRFSLLHITCAEVIGAGDADWLREYVRGGGALVVEFPFACRDDNTWVSRTRPNHGLSDLLGCTEQSRVIAVQDGSEVAAFQGAGGARALGWRVALQPTTGQPIAHWSDGSVAAVRNNYGSGVVCSLGISLSLSFTDDLNSPVLDVLSRILDSVGLRDESIGGNRVWLRRRAYDDGEIWFLFNVTNMPQQIVLPSQPKAVWEATDCSMENLRLTLAGGATMVAEMSLTEEAQQQRGGLERVHEW